MGGQIEFFKKNPENNILVEEIIKQYFDSFICPVINYKYYGMRDWNYQKIYVNPSFSTDLGIDSGHCVATSIMINCLIFTKGDPEKFIHNFRNIDNGELVYLVTCFSDFLSFTA